MQLFPFCLSTTTVCCFLCSLSSPSGMLTELKSCCTDDVKDKAMCMHLSTLLSSAILLSKYCQNIENAHFQSRLWNLKLNFDFILCKQCKVAGYSTVVSRSFLFLFFYYLTNSALKAFLQWTSDDMTPIVPHYSYWGQLRNYIFIMVSRKSWILVVL